MPREPLGLLNLHKGLAAFNLSIRNKKKPTSIYYHHFIWKIIKKAVGL